MMTMRMGSLAMIVALALTAPALAGPLVGAVSQPKPAAQPKPCGQEQAGYWMVSVKNEHGDVEQRLEPYYPMPGDILLYNYDSWHISLVLRIAGTGAPMHSAIVIARPDGTPAILEVGPNSRPHAFTKTYIMEVLPRLTSYPGAIQVRRPRQPLTPEQSAELTDFALAQEGKKFAVGRLALQMTPFRCRYGIRNMLFARTHLDRDRWICSENVVAAATVAGLLSPRQFHANAMYPRDLAYDERYDLSPIFHLPVAWMPQPPLDAVSRK